MGHGSVRRGTPTAKPAPSAGPVHVDPLLEPLLESERLSPSCISDRSLVFGVALAAIAGLTGALHSNQALFISSVALNVASVFVAIGAVWQTPWYRHLGHLAGPIGTICIALSALGLPPFTVSSRAILTGASLIACVMLMRVVIQRDSVKLIAQRLRELLVPLPTMAQAPPDEAAFHAHAQVTTVAVENLRVGDEILVPHGHAVPIDGVIVAGEARVMPFPKAGSSVAVSAGDSMLAGAPVVEGAIRIAVTATRPQRTLARALQLQSPDDASLGWLPLLQHAFRAWSGYVLLFLCALVWVLSAPTEKLQTLGVFLVVLPILALDRSVFMPSLAAAVAAAERGVFFQNRRALLKTGAVNVVGMRSRGIVTEGRLEVVDTKTWGETPMTTLLPLVMAAEDAFSGHPIANALLRFAKVMLVQERASLSKTLREGRGIVGATLDGVPLVLGNRQLLLDRGVSVALAEEEIKKAESLGRTVVLLALGGRVHALFALQDEPSPHARVAVQRLVDMDMEVVLLSGDHSRTVATIAGHLGIDHVKAELTAPERAQEVRKLRDAGNVVAVVGYPAHDAAHLAEANVAVALASAGRGLNLTDYVTLVSKDLRDAADALWIARATRRTIRRALWIVGSAGVLFSVAAVLGQLSAIGAAIVALSLDLYTLPKAHRLLRRIDLRVPPRTW
ncbi:MAG: cation-translocating P-type ATPase [Myxococcales bacterium]|nr:cation-translocating P-type ATPase [Myxococcales bacterium]